MYLNYTTLNERIDYYAKEYEKYPLLSLEEELILAEKSQNGNLNARDLLVLSNMRYVVLVACNFFRRYNLSVSFDSLVSAGYTGAFRAAERYDAQYMNKFITYAQTYIEKEIRRAIKEESWMADKEQLDEPIANQDGAGEEVLTKADLLMGDSRADNDLLSYEMKEYCHYLMDQLPALQRNIISMEYGLDDGVEQREKTIASDLGYSREWIRRSSNKGFTTLRECAQQYR